MKFSIIVPCYNLAPWIRQCLDSVLAQSYADWECVVVDDGSSDGSGDMLDEYARQDDRIKVIHQKNAGEGGARNAGLEVVKGEWVFFLDGDDLMLPGTLERLAQVASDGVDLIRFGYASFDDGEKMESPASTDAIAEVDVSHEIKMSDFITYMWQHLYRRNVIAGLRFKGYKRGCDRVFLSEVLLDRVKAVLVIDDICYGYRTRMESAVNSFPSTQVLRDEMDHRLDIMEMIDGSLKKVEYKGDYWLEGYFTNKLPMIMLDRQSDFKLIKKAWRERLPRICAVKGLSLKGRWLLRLSLSRLFRLVGDFLVFTIPYLRYRSPILKPVTRLYRRVRHHGEFAGNVTVCAFLLMFAGCVQMELSSAADCDENSKMQFRDVTSVYGWDWGESVQTMFDNRMQNSDGRVDERAIQRIVVSQKWWEVLATWGSLGIAKPVELTIWLEAAQ